MLETYFKTAKMRGHLRSGPTGQYLDGFAAALERQCYSPATAVRYLRAAAHVGHVLAEQRAGLGDIDLAAFEEHLRSCRCPRARGGRRNHHTVYGAKLFRRHLVELGVCRAAVVAAMESAERLPLPQDVGDAIAAYLECRPSASQADRVFLRTIAPCRPFRRGDSISSVVKRCMQRAGISSPVKGAHVLRHTAATEMLRHGVPLEKIGLVLRHRGIDTTAYYAKADVALLKQVAQPWPEAL